MSLYLDLKYINLVANRLDLFKRRNQTLFNFRCPLCGDSQTKRNKARGYFYRVPNKNDMSFKCHNCNTSMYFGNFLKDFSPLLYGDYVLEKYKNTMFKTNTDNEIPVTNFVPHFKPKTLLDEMMDRLDTLPDDNIAVMFARKRKIPEDKFDRLYFIDDISKIEQLSDKYKDRLTEGEPRLVIPAYDEKEQLEGLTCRALKGEELRYVTIKIKDDASLIFGLEHLNKKEHVYAVEGPLDSFFIPNAIAVGGTSFSRLGTLGIPQERLTIVLDNQPRNKEVCKMYRKYINANYRICLWPEDLQEKDINDIVLSGKTCEEVKSLIDKNTHQGLSAQLKFSSWSKCNV